jgi:antitoxin VapB
MNTLMTRVFNNGNSQAVRIPAELRLDADRVLIYRNEQGDLVLHPLQPERGAALMQAVSDLHAIDASFVAALEEDRRDSQPMQERDAL